jgi:hypothetical protein
MWKSKTNLSRTLLALQVSSDPKHISTSIYSTLRTSKVLTTQLAPRPNVVGIELINEPANNDHLGGWYDDTLAALRRISPDMPFYIRQVVMLLHPLSEIIHVLLSVMLGMQVGTPKSWAGAQISSCLIITYIAALPLETPLW